MFCCIDRFHLMYWDILIYSDTWTYSKPKGRSVHDKGRYCHDNCHVYLQQINECVNKCIAYELHSNSHGMKFFMWEILAINYWRWVLGGYRATALSNGVHVLKSSVVIIGNAKSRLLTQHIFERCQALFWFFLVWDRRWMLGHNVCEVLISCHKHV